MREELAGRLEQLLYTARKPAGRYRVPLRRTPILLNAPILREVASDLQGPAPVSARGVAMLRELMRAEYSSALDEMNRELGIKEPPPG